VVALSASANADTGTRSSEKPASTLVATTSGLVQGVTTPAFQQFLGVPYAAPPVRDLRFAPPVVPTKWKGVRAADRQSPACLQFQPSGVREEQATSEDCVYLDVYRRGNVSKSKKLPVMVWFHG
jgi:para-nitrobenzyl esterase